MVRVQRPFQPDGKETFTLPSGIKYVGDVKNSKEHGQGTLTHPSGHQYVGEYQVRQDRWSGNNDLSRQMSGKWTLERKPVFGQSVNTGLNIKSKFPLLTPKHPHSLLQDI
jgi:hypothetical protein